MIKPVLSLNNDSLGMILFMPTLANGHNFARSDAQEENLLVGVPNPLALGSRAK